MRLELNCHSQIQPNVYHCYSFDSPHHGSCKTRFPQTHREKKTNPISESFETERARSKARASVRPPEQWTSTDYHCAYAIIIIVISTCAKLSIDFCTPKLGGRERARWRISSHADFSKTVDCAKPIRVFAVFILYFACVMAGFANG